MDCSKGGCTNENFCNWGHSFLISKTELLTLRNLRPMRKHKTNSSILCLARWGNDSGRCVPRLSLEIVFTK